MVQLQARYPTASLTAEFVTVHQDHFVVRALVQIGGITLATGMAAATDIEQAEDRAKIRVLSALGIGSLTPPVQSSVQPQHAAYSPSPLPIFSSSTDFVSPESLATSAPPEATSHLSTNLSTPPLKPSPLTDLAQTEEPTSALSSLDQPSSQPLNFTNSTDFAPSPPLEDDRTEYEFSYEPEENQPENYGTESYNRESYSPESYGIENYESTSDTLPKNEPDPIPSPLSPLSLDATDPTLTDPTFTDPTLTASVSSKSASVSTSGTSAPTKPASSSKAKSTKRKSENAEIAPSNAGENDRSEEIAKIGLEMKRLGWTTEQGRNYLKRTYGKRSRQELDDSELIDFLRYLESQVSPSESLF